MGQFSSEWFRDYEARQAAKKGNNILNAPHGTHKKEIDLHREILESCASNGWIALHGSMAHRTHRTIGEPDFCCIIPGGVIFIECKRKGQKLRPEQAAFGAWLKTLGHTLYVVTSLEQFHAAANEVMNQPKKAIRSGSDGK